MAGLRKANGSSIRCHTATGTQRLSYAGRAMMASPPRLCWMAQWTAPTSWPMSNRKVDGVEDAIKARGARAVFLPAYSPDLNPIEQLFARLKSFLRKMKARTGEKLWTAIATF